MKNPNHKIYTYCTTNLAHLSPNWWFKVEVATRPLQSTLLGQGDGFKTEPEALAAGEKFSEWFCAGNSK